MRHLIRTVKLKFFEDESEETGLAPANSINRGFDAFYDGIGIFHDVIEHWFEGYHKYFQGSAAFNMGGEMVAMGAAWYFFDEIGLYKRQVWPGIPFVEAIRNTTQYPITSLITDNYPASFGDKLVCEVPDQSPVKNIELEKMIKILYDKIKSTSVSEEDFERCKTYKDSVTFRRVANLHRYGYRMSARFIQSCPANFQALSNFIDTWEEFCTKNPAKAVAEVHSGITFRLYKEKGILSWTAQFERKPEFMRYPDKMYYRIPILSESTDNVYDYAG